MNGLISYQEHNALRPHGINTITYWDAWQLSPGACGNGMTRPRYAIKHNIGIASKYGRTNPRRQLYRDHIVLTMRITSPSSNPQSTIRTPKTILKHYEEFYLLKTLSQLPPYVRTRTPTSSRRRVRWYTVAHESE